MKTRCKDKYGMPIYVGDILHVEEFPGKYVGGSLNFEGLVTIEADRAMVTYYDIGEEESYPISMFPIDGRRIFNQAERYVYWKTAYLGGEPRQELWRDDMYRQFFDANGERRE